MSQVACANPQARSVPANGKRGCGQAALPGVGYRRYDVAEMSYGLSASTACTVLCRLAMAAAFSSSLILFTANADAKTRGSMIAATIKAIKIRMRMLRCLPSNNCRRFKDDGTLSRLTGANPGFKPSIHWRLPPTTNVIANVFLKLDVTKRCAISTGSASTPTGAWQGENSASRCWACRGRRPRPSGLRTTRQRRFWCECQAALSTRLKIFH